MHSKFSHLIQAGAIIHTANGGIYRCTSKIASSDGVSLRFADLQGKPVDIPANFRPISPALAHFASWMRLAFNRDFDRYVKEYINLAGLPVDSTMDWSKFFSVRVAPKLVSKDPEVQDEAIHDVIINSLADRKILSNFSTAIKKFPSRIQELPLERQVTTFLMQSFNWRVSEANRYIKESIFQNNTNSMWTLDRGDDQEDIDRNLLDTEEYATGTQAYDAVDSDADIQTFRRGFEAYLLEKFRNETATQYLSLFDLLYAHLREGDIPKGNDLYEEWKGEDIVNEEGAPVVQKGKSQAWFKALFAKLPQLIDVYVTKELGDEEVNSFITVMQNIAQAWGYNRNKQPQQLTPIHASLGGLKLADEFPINHNIEPPPSNDSNSSGSGGGGGGMSLGDLGSSAGEAGEAAGGAGEALEALAPLALVATWKDEKLVGCKCPTSKRTNPSCPIHGKGADSKKNAAQWEVPKCKGCSNNKSLTDCLGCHEKFCGDCLLNHHANNPSHDRVLASAKKADLAEEYAQGDNYYECAMCHTKNWTRDKDGVLRCLTCHPLAQHNPVASKKADNKPLGCYHGKNIVGETCWRCGGKEPYCSPASGTPTTEMQPRGMDNYKAKDTKKGVSGGEIHKLIEDVIGSGFFEEEGDDFFSWRGCEYCSPGMGSTVRKIKGYRNLEEAQAPNREEFEYDFQICGDCLYKLIYGEE